MKTDGQVRVAVDDAPPHVARAPGALVDQALDGLQVGQDTEGTVGDYAPPFTLQGTVPEVTIELSE